jgi:phage gp29-like protein
VSEIVWDYKNNVLVPIKIESKPQEYFAFNRNNQLIFSVGTTLVAVPVGLPVLSSIQTAHPYKFLLTTNEADFSNPYGYGALSDCFWPVTFKKGGMKFWAKFIEKYGMPHVVGKLPRDASEPERNDLSEALQVLAQDSSSVIPDDASIEFLENSSRSSSTEAYKEFIAQQNAEISIAITGHDASMTSTPGKLGGENNAENVRDDLIDADSITVSNTINMLFKWILKVNNIAGPAPQLQINPSENIDKTLAERDKTLKETGIVFTKKYFQKAYNLADDDFDLASNNVQLASRRGELHSPQLHSPQAHIQFASTQSQTPSDTINTIVENAITRIPDDYFIDEIKIMLSKATSLDEFQAMLLDSYNQIKIDTHAKKIQDALITAELAGRYDITK